MTPQVAQARGTLDLAIDEDLRTEFSTDPTNGTDPRAVAEILNHPYIHPCVSDGGAHVRYLTLGTWPVNLLATWTRDRQVMSLEKAHYKISGLPAWIAGFTDRGILREGFSRRQGRQRCPQPTKKHWQ